MIKYYGSKGVCYELIEANFYYRWCDNELIQLVAVPHNIWGFIYTGHTDNKIRINETDFLNNFL